MADASTPFRISMAGAGGLLLDVAGETFSEALQDRLHSLARMIRAQGDVREAVLGMNNLLVTFDALTIDPEVVEKQLRALWAHAAPDPSTAREWEVAVRYGGANGPDLAFLAEHTGLRVDEIVSRHAGAVYRVEAVGAMPGFVYLSGLDPVLACPRRASPRASVPQGAVMIGGAQAGIMPCTAPSGWHILGMTDMVLFDPPRDPPASFRPGDRIRFCAQPS